MAARTRDKIVITQQSLRRSRPVMELIPRAKTTNFVHHRHAWWLLSDGLIIEYLGILGFELVNKYRVKHLCVAYDKPRLETCATFVLGRVASRN